MNILFSEVRAIVRVHNVTVARHNVALRFEDTLAQILFFRQPFYLRSGAFADSIEIRAYCEAKLTCNGLMAGGTRRYLALSLCKKLCAAFDIA